MDTKREVRKFKSRQQTCDSNLSARCNAYWSSIKYPDGWKRVYFPCEYCQADWHKEVMDQLHEDLGDDIMEG